MKLKKTLAAVLSAAMIVTSLPAAVFAESRSGNKINLYVGEDTTLTFDVGMDQSAKATIEGNDEVADVKQSVSSDLVAEAAVSDVTDGYYYIKDARYSADQSDIFNNNRYLTGQTITANGANFVDFDQKKFKEYSWIKEDSIQNAATFHVTTNEDGTKNLEASDLWLNPELDECTDETASWNKDKHYYVAGAEFTSEAPTEKGFTFRANQDGTVGIKAPNNFTYKNADGSQGSTEVYLNSYGGGNKAVFIGTSSGEDGSKMYLYPVHYELTVKITAEAEGRFTVRVGDEIYTVVVSDKDSGSLQEVYVGLGETEEFTVDAEGTTDNTGKVDDSVAFAKITSTAEIGNEVSNITDGLYVLQDNRVTDAAGADKRYLTTKTTTLNDGYTWLVEGTADQAALFKMEANDDGTYAVSSGDQYLNSNVELTVDKTNTAHYEVGSVTFSENANESKIKFEKSGEYFGIKPAEQNAYLASYRGQTRALWQANTSIATAAGSAFKIYEAYYNTKVAITGKAIGTTDVEVGDVTFRVHVIDAIKVPVKGSIDITNDSVTSGTDAEVSNSLEGLVEVSCENGKFTLTNDTVPEEITTGSVTVGGVKYSVTVGVDETINMAVGAEKEFASSNGSDAYFIPVDGSVSLVGQPETNIAERISGKDEIVAGEQYLIVGARVQQAMSSSVIGWQASTAATGFELTGGTIANNTDKVSLDGYENARVVFEKTGDYTYKLKFADTGKYIKFNERYNVNVTDSAEDASEITVNKNNNSTAYGDNILALTSKSLYLSDWGGKGTSKGLTLAGLGDGSEMWLYQVKDAKITVKANQTGTSYVTIGGKTYEINVGTAVAEVGGTSYISVAEAVANAKSGETVTVLSTDGAETVEIPVDVKVAYNGSTLGVPYYQTGNNENTKISAQRENGTNYLFLPSSAGEITENILEGIPEDVTVSIDDSVATITWKIGNVTVTKSITIMKSSGVSALYLSDLDQTVENLNASKNNAATTGNVVKIAADGTEQATATIKKLKGRGNTSWSEIRDNNTEDNKKPYNINLNEKTKLNVNADYKSKKWCLIANNYYDFSGTNNNTAYTLYQKIHGDAAVHAEPVDLYMNGEYRGMYLIVDKVEIGENRVNITEPKYDEPDTVETARVLVDDYENHFDADASVTYWTGAISTTNTERVSAINGDDPAINAGVLAYKYVSNSTSTKDGGFILEVSHQYTDENCWFITNHGVMISLKEPEFATKEQMQKVAIYVQEFEDALYSDTGFNSKGKHYSEYIDLASLAKTYMLSCFTAQNDFLDCSDYFYTDWKNGELTTLKAGPAWDYDVSAYAGVDGLYQKKSSTNVNGNQAWISQLLTKGDFVKELQKLQQGAFATAVDTVISTSIPNYINLTTNSLNMDQAMWKWNTTVAERAAKHLSDVNGRKTRWNEIWSDETNALRGVVIEKTNDALTATASGATGYQWYQVDTDDMTQATAVDGATESTFIPTETGYYYVVATGAALAGTEATHMRSNAVYVEKQDSQVTPVTPSEAEKTVIYGDKVTLSVSVSPKATATYATETPAANKIAFYCGNTPLGTVDVTYTSATEGKAFFEYDTTEDILKMGENTVTAYYGGGVVLNANDVAGTIKVTVKKAEQAAPAAPTAESVTRTSITLKAVEPNPNENGAKVQYRVNDGEWQYSPVFEGLRAGTAYTFAVRYAELEKYNASPEATATISTRKKSSSSSDTSAPTYGVSAGKTENGKLTVDPANAAAGETVTITVKPDSGYQLDEITVKDKDGNTIKVKKQDDNEYTFTMPGGKVSIDATFAEKDTKDDNQNNNTETKENPFVDVKTSDWFYGSVLKAYEEGWMSGTSAVTFAPNASTTRGMIVSVLYRLEGSPEAGDSTFTDVKAGAYYAKAVAWAAENGIVGGYGDGTFGPNDEITREQLAAILYRYAQFKGYDVSKKADLTAYSDYAQVSAYAKDAVAWANAAGILSGTSATTLSPRDHATRAQVAAILARFTDAFQA